MNMNQFTQKSVAAIQRAQAIAVEYQHMQVDQEHLAAALLEDQAGLIPQLLGKMNVQVDFALIVVANDAGSVGQLDRSGEMQYLAVAVTCLGGNLNGIAVFNYRKAADTAENNAVLDTCVFACLSKTEQHIGAGLKSDDQGLAEFAFCHVETHTLSSLSK